MQRLSKMKIKIGPWGIGSSLWKWHIVNSRNEIIATSCQNYVNKSRASRAASYYAKQFTCIFIEVEK